MPFRCFSMFFRYHDEQGVSRVTKKRVPGQANGSLLDPTPFVRDGGVTFGALFQQVLEVCASNRLRVLHHRLLMKTPDLDVYRTQVSYTSLVL